MEEGKRSRRRAVRLTLEGSKLLQDAIHDKWNATSDSARLTRERRAEVLDVSVVTAEKILRGRGVDKSTLIHAFKNASVEWFDAYCESASEPVSAAPLQLEITPAQARPKRPLYRRLVLITLCLSLCIFCLWNWFGTALEFIQGKSWVSAYVENLNVGTTAYHKGDYALAKKAIEKAVELARTNRDAVDLSLALRMSGEIAAEQGNLQEAITDFQDALVFRQSLKQPEYEPSIREVMADAQMKLGKFVEARENLELSLRGFENVGDAGGVASACRGLGSLAATTGHDADAKKWFQRGIEALRGHEDSDMCFDIRARIAMVQKDERKYPEALMVLHQCLDHWEAKRHTRWIATTKYQIGAVLWAMGQHEQAVNVLRDSQSGFELVGDQRGALECSRYLSRDKGPSLSP